MLTQGIGTIFIDPLPTFHVLKMRKLFWHRNVRQYIHTSLLHSMDPQISQMTIGCVIGHNNTIHIIQVQFIPL
jgi:hypothetical protein